MQNADRLIPKLNIQYAFNSPATRISRDRPDHCGYCQTKYASPEPQDNAADRPDRTIPKRYAHAPSDWRKPNPVKFFHRLFI